VKGGKEAAQQKEEGKTYLKDSVIFKTQNGVPRS